MWNKWVVVAQVPLLMCLIVLVSGAPATPTTRPASPPSKVAITLPAEVSIKDRLPLTVSLSYDVDEKRHMTNYAFLFLLFDENGKQVALEPFIREAIYVKVPLDGREPTYKPRMVFDPHCEALKPGRKYQVVCVLPFFNSAPADSAWFTLTE